MNQFYVSIVFIGILLITISLIGVAYDRKKSHDYSKQIDDKKEELITVINDAEQMVEEMNKFSDYIVTQMDIKYEEVNMNLKELENRLGEVNTVMMDTIPCYEVVQSDKVVNGSMIDIQTFPEVSYQETATIINTASIKTATKTTTKIRDKVVPINNKYKEVIRLSNEGHNDTEIAKLLHMGKGEVSLVIGMNRQ